MSLIVEVQYEESDGRWVVYLPQLMECSFGDGLTKPEAYKNALITLEMYLKMAEEDGKVLPDPIRQMTYGEALIYCQSKLNRED